VPEALRRLFGGNDVFVKFGIAALLALPLVGLHGGIGWAGGTPAPISVNIDDLTDTPIVTLEHAPSGIVPTFLPDTAGEFLHFTLPVLPGAPVSTSYSDLFEDVIGGTLSDRLLFSHAAGSPSLDVRFASDPATITLPPGAINLFTLVESGAFQFVGAFVSPDGNSYSFQVRSDRADVPAPATLLLLGSGLIVLSGATLRRRRRHPRRPRGGRTGLLCLPSRRFGRKT